MSLLQIKNNEKIARVNVYFKQHLKLIINLPDLNRIQFGIYLFCACLKEK